MKYGWIVILIILSLIWIFIIHSNPLVNYKGYIEDKYKICEYGEAVKYYVIFKPDSGQFMQIYVEANRYYSMKIGDTTYFELRKNSVTK